MLICRKRPEISWRSLLGALLPVSEREATRSARPIRLPHDGFQRSGSAFLSVRSALDLYFSVRAFAPGSEVLFSGANVPDMAAVAVAHGLRPVPVDFSLAELAPNLDQFQMLAGSRTKGVVFTHLFGSRMRLDHLAAWCASAGLDLIEDAAEAFAGRDFQGEAGATLSLFSFGPIKAQTALGGGVALSEEEELLSAMEALEATFPVMSGGEFRRRARKFLGWKWLSGPIPFGLFERNLRRGGRELDDVLHAASRSFPGDQLIEQLRRRPPAAMLALLRERLRMIDDDYYRRRQARGSFLRDRLAGVVDLPGAATRGELDYWVFPIQVTGDTDAFVRSLRRGGFDATRRATLAPLSEYGEVPVLQRDFAKLVYLPFNADMPESLLERMVKEVRHAAQASNA